MKLFIFLECIVYRLKQFPFFNEEECMKMCFRALDNKKVKNMFDRWMTRRFSLFAMQQVVADVMKSGITIFRYEDGKMKALCTYPEYQDLMIQLR